MKTMASIKCTYDVLYIRRTLDGPTRKENGAFLTRHFPRVNKFYNLQTKMKFHFLLIIV